MNYTLEIVQEDNPANPRTEWDNAAMMVCFHSRYNLGDPFPSHGYSQKDFSGWDGLLSRIKKDHKPIAVSPLYMYDHGGLTISASPFSCPWDSGQIGFVFVPRLKAVQECPHKSRATQKNWACATIIQEVSVYDKFLRGEFCGYIIKDEDGDVVDSCYGYDDFDYCRSEGESALDIINNKEKGDDK